MPGVVCDSGFETDLDGCLRSGGEYPGDPQQRTVARGLLNHRICEQVIHGALDLLGRHLGLNLVSQRNPNIAYLDAVVGGKHAAHAVAARVGQAL